MTIQNSGTKRVELLYEKVTLIRHRDGYTWKF